MTLLGSSAPPAPEPRGSAPLGEHLEVTEVTDPSLLQEVLRLRVLAWRESPHAGPELEGLEVLTDEHDGHALHFAILSGGAPVACARLCVHDAPEDIPDWAMGTGWDLPRPIGCFNRLVVHPGFRRRGLTALLDRVRLARARELGCRSVFASTAGERQSRLIKLGFERLCQVTTAANPLVALSRSRVETWAFLLRLP